MARKSKESYHRFHELDWVVIINGILAALNMILHILKVDPVFQITGLIVGFIFAIALISLYSQIY